ncbi:cytochrome P450 [Acrocarpospora phusangensis]|uniref:Cytochrome P450 n=1 Tax=Acrocarpospora phusangensis TaxID=1070424 RepID=A0A919Q601_9ACTN|nr:cytochrome P450 [Acrocarpospora phusangensis]GIH22236.1 cytochrome P450 [Acrocarpospora phusangensis]
MAADMCPYPFVKADPMAMPEEFTWLREHEPTCRVTLPSGDLAWLVTRYHDVKAVLSDTRFSRDLNRPDAARMNTAIGFGNYGNPFADPPVHTRWRGLVARAFTPRHVEHLRPRVQEIVDDLVDRLLEAGPPGDIMEALAFPLPITVLCEMIGVPVEDHVRFRGWVHDMLSSELTSEQRTQAAMTLIDYSRALTGAKRVDPADDLLSGLIAVRDEDDGRLDENELFVTIMTLLVAGYKTTAAQLGKGLLTLFRHPDQLEALRADPALIDSAVEELLRYSPPGGGVGITRYATEDLKVGDVVIPKGSTVIVARHAANRDEAHFPDGERFDVGRPTANQHLTFGAGPAFCFGAPLARMEMRIALETLLRRAPGLRLAVPEEEVPWTSDTAAQAPEIVPVTWEREMAIISHGS